METVKTGWLEKKSVMRWQKRWFALYRKRDSSRAWFAYFDGEPRPGDVLDEARVARAKGAVELSWGAKVDVLPGAGSRFQVILAKHALKCGAADDAARDSWMRALRSEASHAVRSATVQFAGEAWQIDPKYELVKKVGSGAYGCVASARDTSAEARERFGAPYDVAIKKVANVFEDAVDAKRILREVRLMRNWNHPCVLGLYDIVEPSHSADFEDLYIVTPLSTTDLSRVIYSKTALSSDQQLYLFYQTLCGVHYINSAGVIHRDLKPANLLVDVKTCGLKVCDFGLSRCLSHEGAALTDGYIEAPAVDGGANNFTEYVVTRWYRAPEVMLGFHHYGAAIDVWASACIFVEMLIKEPLFPGNDYLHQLKIILKQLGKPTDPGDSWFVTNKSARQFLDGLPAYAAQPLDRKVPGAPPGALDLVLGMLRFDPRKRTPVSDCIDHACLADYREHELEARAGFHVEMDDVEAVALTKSAIQRLLYDDVRAFHRDLPADRGRVFSDAEELAEHVTIDHAATPMDQSPR
ncbi:MAP kinase [Aureococcus anophagefferens]|uniref:MAP kinase n=2 Tax=Aureococcus anophagefferens TaxID=44056 RepID=A0ABR1FZD1_AURAN